MADVVAAHNPGAGGSKEIAELVVVVVVVVAYSRLCTGAMIDVGQFYLYPHDSG